MPDSRPLRPGDPERLGGYRLIGLLGEGGQGIVYLGEADDDSEPGDADGTEDTEDTGGGIGGDSDEAGEADASGNNDEAGETDGREGDGAGDGDEPRPLYAIKLLRTHLSSDTRARRYFAKEVAAAQRIDPSFTARIIEADMEGRTPYIVSEYVDGRPLSETVRSNGPLNGPELHGLAVGTLNALIAIHQANVVHRDLKPSNVLLSADRPRVIDFGIARALDSTISVSSGVVGTPAYMAPEQLTGQQITPAADVFAWAATMVFAATGAPPFGQDSIPVVMHRILNTDPFIGDLQSPLRELVWYCLYKHPSQRPTAQQVLAGLTGTATQSPAQSPAQSPVPGSGWGAPAVHTGPSGYAHPSPVRSQPLQSQPLQTPPPQTPPPQSSPGRPVPAPMAQPPASAPPAGTPVWSTDPNARGTDPNLRGTEPGRADPRLPPHQPAPSSGWGAMGDSVTKPPPRARRPWLPVVAAAAGVALVAGAGVFAVRLIDGDDTPTDEPTTLAADAGLVKVVNPSTAKGGTLRLGRAFDFDSIDPGNMYQVSSWNFSRLYARPLLTYKSVPGTEGLRPTPDLATGPGEPSEDLKTWTYRLRPGVKYEDGTPVTANDVRYAVARTFDADVLGSGPAYLRGMLDAGAYSGPYQDKDLSGFRGVTTPNEQTVVFHLREPFADFDYIAALPQTAPVPAAKDTGTGYARHVVSTGPYKVENYVPEKSITLVRNPHWSDDGNRKQLVDRIELTIQADGATVDNRLLSGQADLDVTGSGLQDSSMARVSSDASLQEKTDNPTTGFLRYVALSTKVKPFDDVHCRRAVQYAVDRAGVRTVFGGPRAADPATNLLPPVISGRQRFDAYPTDLAKARQELAACGKPDGFTTKIAIRKDRPAEQQVATVLNTALSKVGIRVQTTEYPVTEFYRDYAGKPSFVHKNGLGMILSAWGPDYPTGLGFFPLLVDGDHITSQSNSNFAELDDPEINGLLDTAAKTRDQAGREAITADVDRKVMNTAAIVPLVYEKSLLYRSSRLTNVYVNQMFGDYDLANLGLK